MRTRARTGRRRRCAAPAALLVALLVGLLGPVLVPGAAAGQPSLPPATRSAAPTPTPSASPSATPAPVAVDPCAGASEDEPVQAEVTTLLPRAPSRPDEPFQVAGRLRNCGEQAVGALELRLAVGDRIASRGELQRAADEPVVGNRRLTRPAGAEELAPGGTTTFDLRLRVSELRLGRLGVYPLAVQVRGRYGDDRRRTPVGLASTFVPWFPDGTPAPTRIAWLWPLVDQPRRGPDEVMLDDELAELVAPAGGLDGAGRLHELLSSARDGAAGACERVAAAPDDGVPPPPPAPQPCRGEPVPMTYGVDPSLLYSLDAMTQPYPVRVDGALVARAAEPAAGAWLTSLRTAVADADVLALPFGDPDVVAMTRTASGLREEVEPLRRLGQAEVARVLGTDPLESVAWPPPGPLPAALDVVLGAQTRAVVLDVAALPPASPGRSRTPSARTELPSVTGPVNGLVVEDVLSRLVEAEAEVEAQESQGVRLAEQRWIAETAIIAAEAPSVSRTLVVAPRRAADVDPAVAAAVIADTGRLPWLCPVALADVAAGRERCRTVPDDQAPAGVEPVQHPLADDAEPPDDRDGELSPVFLERLAEVNRAADQFTEAVLVGGTEQATATRARLLRATGRAASAAWRDAPLEGQRMLRLLEQEVAALRSQVTLVSEPVLLTGSTGVLPLVVRNELDQAVEVGVVLDETSAARLALSSAPSQVVPARSATELRVAVEPRTSGRFVVLATLVDQEGRPIGEAVALEVRSTGYGRVALAVTGAAAAVLIVAAGARITRRALRRGGGGPA